MEYFLNSVEEKLEQTAFDWREWKQAGLIDGGFKFQNLNQSLIITVIFSSSYHDANEIGKANSLPSTPVARWNVNGDVMYLVESPDQNMVSEILGLFAGKE